MSHGEKGFKDEMKIQKSGGSASVHILGMLQKQYSAFLNRANARKQHQLKEALLSPLDSVGFEGMQLENSQ